LPQKFRLFFLTLGSLGLYILLSGTGIFLLLGIAGLAYVALLFPYPGRWLVLLTLLPLFFYKYGQGWGMGQSALALPAGLSFYTFQCLAFSLQFRAAERPPVSLYLLYVAFFPQVVAGPILSPPYFGRLMQFLRSRFRASRFDRGLLLLASGAAKKTLGDSLGGVADPIFAALGQSSVGELALGLFAFSGRIYLDFSGYSDLALGLGLLFGIRLPDNFRFPYHSTSLGQFWRSWHITLGAFLKHFLYIPLGGNRISAPREYAAIFVTFALGGLWHGAGWLFLCWGALHGFFLVLERFVRRTFPRFPGAIRPLVGRVWTLTVVILLWLPFRMGLEGLAVSDLSPGLLSRDFSSGVGQGELRFVVLVWLGIACGPWLYGVCQRLLRRGGILFYGLAALCLLLSLSLQENRPFIYFVF